MLNVGRSRGDRLCQISKLVLLTAVLQMIFDCTKIVCTRHNKIGLIGGLCGEVFRRLRSLDLSFFKRAGSNRVVGALAIRVVRAERTMNAVDGVFVGFIVAITCMIVTVEVS